MQPGVYGVFERNLFFFYAVMDPARSRRTLWLLWLLLLLLSPVTCNSFRRNLLLLDEQVDEGLHRLHLLVSDQFVVFGDSNEVDEAHIQHLMAVDVPERIEPVSMIQVRVAAKHLLHDTLAVLIESLRETARLANPILTGVIGRGRRIDIIERKGNGHAVHRSGRKHNRVVDFADDPLLHAVDEFGSRNFGGTAVHKPSVC